MSDAPTLVETAIRFFSKLEKNNNRDWFQAHKSEYENDVKEPAKFFVDIVNAELEDLTGRPHKPKIFRVNRDIRFSKDKSPYNAHLHMLWSPDIQKKQVPGWFLGISPNYVRAGTGIMSFEPEVLLAYRRKVADEDANGLSGIIADLNEAEFFLGEPELKRVPKPHDQDHPNGELLRRKGVTMWQDFADEAGNPGSDLLALTTRQFKAFRPLHEWLLKLV